MKRILYITALLFCLVSLGCSGDARPEGLLSEDEMVPILSDLQIAYSGVDQTVRNAKLRNNKYEEMNQLVLKKHKVDRQVFYDSYDWYKQQPILMDTIFQKVLIQLNHELDSLRGSGGGQPSKKRVKPTMP